MLRPAASSESRLDISKMPHHAGVGQASLGGMLALEKEIWKLDPQNRLPT